MVRADTGIRLALNGAKAADSLSRRYALRDQRKTDTFYPIKEWNKFDVLAYLRMRGIALPEISTSTKSMSSGIALDQTFLLWIYDNYPADFAKIETVFPYVGAVIARREFYGLT